MSTPAYSSKIDDVVCSGWSQVGSIWLTTEPLRDQSTGRYAHLCYRDAIEVAERMGAELPSHDDVCALRDASIILAPVTLPDMAMLKAAGINPGDVHAIDAYRNANMMSEEWATIHDEHVQAQLDALGWDGSRPVSNIGKVWISGATPGRARLMGWYLVAQKKWIQSGVYPPGCHEFHDSHFNDYSSVVVLKRTHSPEAQS